MPPVVAIVGRANSGKTTFIEKLVGELKSRGFRVATIKHTPHGMDFGDRGRDSWRHVQAGSEATAVSSPDRVVLVKPKVPLPPTVFFTTTMLPRLVSVKVQVTVSPGLTSMLVTGLPSPHVAEVRSQPAGTVSAAL